MCDYNETIAVKAPYWSEKETIYLDKCIVATIQMLWENGIRTLNSCCGHKVGFPSVVIEDFEDAEKTATLLEKYDPERKWDVFQWKLVKTNLNDGYISTGIYEPALPPSKFTLLCTGVDESGNPI